MTGWCWTRRTSTGGPTSTTNSSSGTAANLWVALVRSGSIIYGYRSTDGISWTSVGSVSMSPTLRNPRIA